MGVGQLIDQHGPDRLIFLAMSSRRESGNGLGFAFAIGYAYRRW